MCSYPSNLTFMKTMKPVTADRLIETKPYSIERNPSGELMAQVDAQLAGEEAVGPPQPGELVSCVTCPTKFEFDPEKAWAKQCYECFKDDNTRRVCSACLKHRILPTKENEWQKVCSQCYKDSPLRVCEGCKEPKLKAVEPWRQLCKGCWPHRHELLKICTTCKDKPINKGAPKWVETCMSCYMTKRKKNFEICPSCQSTSLNKRKTAPACRDCMIKDGLIIYQKEKAIAAWGKLKSEDIVQNEIH
jgi:hypothetical protein